MGTFSRITLTSMFGTQLERPVLSQNDTTYRGRPRLQPVCCDQCTFLTFDPKRFNYCWMDKTTSKSILYFSSFINCQQKKKAQVLDFQMIWEGRQWIKTQSWTIEEWWLLGLLFFWFQVCFSSCFFLPARPSDWDGQHLPPFSLPSCPKCGVTK